MRNEEKWQYIMQILDMEAKRAAAERLGLALVADTLQQQITTLLAKVGPL